ncbi:glycoside hydrolase family 25 protein [Hygrophoropsis aurantiaca]|uniref:Glycoside hydrolase family 25 protein n=1 Tax=Hygrophoropsis aurantiaca TaxID=72124 RepID=A0ACB7ZZ30_9AGAM|nr:glycoside hydrolase family 25 protein [Hygrophoropsis aurantiaca]
MQLTAYLALFVALVSANPLEKRSAPKGIDVSSYQGSSINWKTVKSNGATFAYIKATEGTTYINPDFSAQYTGATNAGFIRGSYHFAQPSSSAGSTQATYFIKHGGGWSADGITLPGAVDLEAGCYGLSASAMVSWIKSFSSEYHSSEGRYPVIYVTTSWWKSCTGNSGSFGSDNPLWLASWASSYGALPAGWSYPTFWQYADSGSLGPGDQDEFNGDSAGLERMAKGS